jgi:hypothetical protein
MNGALPICHISQLKVSARAGIGLGQQVVEFLGEVDEDRAALEHAERLGARAVDQRGDLRVRVDVDEADQNWSPAKILISQASYSASEKPFSSSSSNMIVTFTPLGVPSE